MAKSSKDLTAEEYNEPVYYCLSCHSLYILVDDTLVSDDWDGSYCGKCNSANIGVCTMGEWLAEEERRKAKRREIEWSK